MLNSGPLSNIRFIRFFSSNKVADLNDPVLAKLRKIWLGMRWFAVTILLSFVALILLSL